MQRVGVQRAIGASWADGAPGRWSGPVAATGSQPGAVRTVGPRLQATRLFLLTLVATVPPLVFDPWGDFDPFFGPKAMLLHGVAVCLLLWWAVAVGRGDVRLDRPTPLLTIGLVFAAWLVASTLLSLDPPRAVWGSPGREDGLLVWFANLLVLATAASMGDRRAWRVVLGAGALAAVVAGLVAIAQHVGVESIAVPTARVPGRVSSTLRNPVFLGGYLTLMAPLTLALALQARDRFRTALWALGTGCVVAATYFTFSRAAWGGVFLGVLVVLGWGVTRRLLRPRRALLVTAVALSVAAAIVATPHTSAPQVPEQSFVGTAETAFDIGASRNAGRLAIWSIAMQMIADRPWFGTGPDQMGAVFEQYRTARFDAAEGPGVGADRAHSEPLHLAVTLGIPGALLCAALVAGVCVRAVGRSRRPREGDIVWVAVGSGVAAYMLASSVSITVPGVHTLCFLLLGGLARPRLGR